MSFAVKHLAVKYGVADRFVFQDLSFRLHDPGFHALFGPSGVGKTTLAKVITGDLTAASGEIASNGLSTFLYSYNLERLPDWSSVGSHLEKVSPTGRRERREALVDSFGLSECLRKRFSLLSLGQQNRVNLLRYLLQDFDLLIMDESLGNVDEPTRERILFSIKEMFPTSYFLYISHNMVEVARFCRCIVVFRGPGRMPAVCTLQGQDARSGVRPHPSKLEKTLIDIVNASS